MTNDNETTGARLTTDDMIRIRAMFSEYNRYVATGVRAPNGTPVKLNVADDIVSQALPALLADRAALVAENARLQHAYDMNETTMNMQDRALKVQHADLANTLAQVTAMRPLVARVAKGVLVDSECPFCWTMLFNSDGPHEADCPTTIARALVATSQTPAAPEGDDA